MQSQNPAGGVSIAISPADNNGLSGGTTGTPPLTRTYNAGTSVTLTAPLAASGNNFQKWQENGSDYSTNPSITVTAGEQYLHGGVSDADGRIHAGRPVRAADRIEHRFVHGPLRDDELLHALRR